MSKTLPFKKRPPLWGTSYPVPDRELAGAVKEMAAIFNKYITFTDDRHALVCALWCAQTWLFQHLSAHGIYTVGYLAFVSPVANCGKSQALTITAALSYGGLNRNKEIVAPPVQITPTPATVYRFLQERQTLILDELDGIVEDTQLVNVLNAGYKWGAVVYRTSGEHYEKKATFETFGPKAFGYIRDFKSLRAIKNTLESRCIRIFMKRRSPDEKINARRLYARSLAREVREIRGKLQAWAMRAPDLTPLFETGEILLEEFGDRENEVWESVFGVAYLAGLLPQAHEAAMDVVELNREELDDNNPDTQLLKDIRDNLDEMCDEAGFWADQAARVLLRLEDRSYHTEKGGWSLTGRHITATLAKYGLRSKHTGPRRLRRINREGLEDVLERHLPREEDDGD